jgi:hypothetical protein
MGYGWRHGLTMLTHLAESHHIISRGVNNVQEDGIWYYWPKHSNIEMDENVQF